MWLPYPKLKNVATMVEHCLHSISGNSPPTCVHARLVAKSCWWYFPNVSLPHLSLFLPPHSPSSDLHHFLPGPQPRPLLCPCLLSLPAPTHLTPANFSGGEAIGAPSGFLQTFQFAEFLQTSGCQYLSLSVPEGFFSEPQVIKAKELVLLENSPQARMEGEQMNKCPSSLYLS